MATWLVPVIGLALSLALLVWGVGGWLVAWWDHRARRTPAPLLPPPSDDAGPGEADDWEPPLPPVRVGAAPPDDAVHGEDEPAEDSGEM